MRKLRQRGVSLWASLTYENEMNGCVDCKSISQFMVPKFVGTAGVHMPMP